MRVIIAGGGTGGHLFPGIAIAEEIVRGRGGEVLFVGTARGLEAKVVPAAGFPLALLDVSGLKRMGALGTLRGLARLPRAFTQSRRILKQFKPDVVVGVGGYASGPLVLAAALGGYPTVVQEQNSRAGFTNRLLARFARRVFVAFEGLERQLPARKIRLTGNPVRRSFAERAIEVVGRRGDALLVLGGSQGSRAVNELVAGAAELLAARAALPRIVHQAGPAEAEAVRARYAALGLARRVNVRPFIDDMPGALADAALVVARAGALTLAELAITRRPAILIPLPTAADDHQTENARAFERVGAAVLMPQPEASPAALADLIAAIMNDSARRAAMATAMRSLGRPNATLDIVAELETFAQNTSRPDKV
jgi:UDP-N-acetylglucosamine--N-acetylmuramyl-(pentapeptide) pyrophosphoryl-undecaprenol N-acetylglucosamine transferase